MKKIKRKLMKIKKISNIQANDDRAVFPFGKVTPIIQCPIPIAFLKAFSNSFCLPLHLQRLDLQTKLRNGVLIIADFGLVSCVVFNELIRSDQTVRHLLAEIKQKVRRKADARPTGGN